MRRGHRDDPLTRRLLDPLFAAPGTVHIGERAVTVRLMPGGIVAGSGPQADSAIVQSSELTPGMLMLLTVNERRGRAAAVNPD